MPLAPKILKRGITEWLEDWKRRGWRTADKKPVKNLDALRGHEMKFKIVSFDKKRSNIVLSLALNSSAVKTTTSIDTSNPIVIRMRIPRNG